MGAMLDYGQKEKCALMQCIIASEAIQKRSQKLDCFVASLLAMVRKPMPPLRFVDSDSTSSGHGAGNWGACP
jgi:hypothetical protein